MGYIKDQEALKKFGNNLKRIRHKKGLSQRALGNKAGIEDSQIRRIEKAKINTSLSTIVAIAKALEVEPKDLMDFEE